MAKEGLKETKDTVKPLINKKRKLCGCKHTKTPPYCDGSHRDVIKNRAKNMAKP